MEAIQDVLAEVRLYLDGAELLTRRAAGLDEQSKGSRLESVLDARDWHIAKAEELLRPLLRARASRGGLRKTAPGIDSIPGAESEPLPNGLS